MSQNKKPTNYMICPASKQQPVEKRFCKDCGELIQRENMTPSKYKLREYCNDHSPYTRSKREDGNRTPRTYKRKTVLSPEFNKFLYRKWSGG